MEKLESLLKEEDSYFDKEYHAILHRITNKIE